MTSCLRNRRLTRLASVAAVSLTATFATTFASAHPAAAAPAAAAVVVHTAAGDGSRAGGVHLHEKVTAQSREERLIALASSWVMDPELVKAQPGDSAKTKRARRELAGLADGLATAMETYDKAAAASQRAAAAAESARLDLAAAQITAANAGARYMRSQVALSQMVRGQYTDAKVDTLALLLDPESDQALRDLSLLDLVGDRQDEAVAEAATASAELESTSKVVAQADAVAQEAATQAHAALEKAATARRAAAADIRSARRLLDAALDTDAARAGGLAGPGVYIRPKGKVSFPLPPGSGFRDNNNWGGSGDRWASTHTGNDLSVACGTPVLAATSGRVQIRTDQGWSGPWLVMVSTGAGKLSTWYAHMQSLNVVDGQRVKAGQQIGAVGTLGNSSGCHLHFEYHPFGGSIYEDSTDPVAWWHSLGAYPAS